MTAPPPQLKSKAPAIIASALATVTAAVLSSFLGTGGTLAGIGLASLISGTASDLVDLPWVGHRSSRWEPEPLRWLGVNAGLWAMQLADRSEARRGRPSWVAARMGRLVGG